MTFAMGTTSLRVLFVALAALLAVLAADVSASNNALTLDDMQAAILAMQGEIADLRDELDDLRAAQSTADRVLKHSRTLLQGQPALQSGNNFPSGLNVDGAVVIDSGNVHFQSTGGGEIHGVSHIRLSNQEDLENYIDGPERRSLLFRITDTNDDNDVIGIEMDTDFSPGEVNMQRILTVKPTGLVGIGTSTPGGQLHVSGGADQASSIVLGEYDSAVSSLKFRIRQGASGNAQHLISGTDNVLTFAKATYVEDDDDTWTRMDFSTCGSINSVNPFWNGCHFAGFAVTDSSSNVGYPRASLHFSASSTSNPDDLRFNIEAGNAAGVPLDFFMSTPRNMALFGSQVGVNVDPRTLSSGTLASAATLAVSGNIHSTTKLSSNGAILSHNGGVQRDFFTVKFTGAGTDSLVNKYIHMKTNIMHQSGIMYRIVLEGYRYFAGQPIFSECVGYPYTNGLVYSNCFDSYSSSTTTQYLSNDGYLVIVSEGHSYYVGFSASAWTLNPAGFGFQVQITEYVLSSSSSHTW